MKKIIIFYLVFGVFIVDGLIAQQNSFGTTPFIYFNQGIYEGIMVGYGIDLNYTRKVTNKIYLNLNFGKGRYLSENTTQLDLEKDETSFLPLTRWGIGADYSILTTKKMNMSVGTEFLLSRFIFVESIHIDNSDQVTFRQTRMNNFHNYLIHLKTENKLGSRTFWTTQISYQPYFIHANEVFMVKSGVGFRF
ncbi:hypothetical protein ACFOUP_12725 [Belliella kenyensis]|uniref:Outer membrane protein beta-barrel domain-containing protein n=1 Tax=Belliella kenyensis TaxID=1472724 RepID=A0ABV8EMK5_9BACT|nr:hypothetical protein [Belliella kenyensis]MCH7400838.1 hypothetical protein [Belliella kenyensis]MDN3601874.1 hypothetical protein [Belliella kenyensis]